MTISIDTLHFLSAAMQGHVSTLSDSAVFRPYITGPATCHIIKGRVTPHSMTEAMLIPQHRFHSPAFVNKVLAKPPPAMLGNNTRQSLLNEDVELKKRDIKCKRP